MDLAWLRRLAFSPAPVFLLLSIVLFALHEPWRDEAQPWLVARDAPNMFEELDSETHPALWYVIAFPLAKLGLPYVSLRVVHLAIAFAALCLFLLHAPFSRTEKWLYSFGYFVLYEYGTITRNYAILVLVLYLIAAMWRKRFDRPWLHGALLFLLTQTLAHGVLLAGVLAAAYGIEWLARERRVRGWRPLVAPGLAALGALAAYAVIAPAPDIAEWRTSWTTTFQPYRLGTALVRVVLPLPRIEGWPSSDVLATYALVPFALALAVWIGAGTAFRKRPRALGLWLAGTIVLLAVFQLKSIVSAQLRHYGLLFVWLLFCLWLARLERPDPVPRVASVALVALLVLQAASSIPAVYNDARYEFSGGPGAARYLIDNGYADATTTLVGIYPSFLASTVLVPLPDTMPKLWFLQTGKYGSYTRFTHEDIDTFRNRNFTEMFALFDAEIERTQPERAIVITSYDVGPRDDLQLLDAHDGLASGDDTYVYLYRP